MAIVEKALRLWGIVLSGDLQPQLEVQAFKSMKTEMATRIFIQQIESDKCFN